MFTRSFVQSGTWRQFCACALCCLVILDPSRVRGFLENGCMFPYNFQTLLCVIGHFVSGRPGSASSRLWLPSEVVDRYCLPDQQPRAHLFPRPVPRKAPTRSVHQHVRLNRIVKKDEWKPTRKRPCRKLSRTPINDAGRYLTERHGASGCISPAPSRS